MKTIHRLVRTSQHGSNKHGKTIVTGHKVEVEITRVKEIQVINTPSFKHRTRRQVANITKGDSSTLNRAKTRLIIHAKVV